MAAAITGPETSGTSSVYRRTIRSPVPSPNQQTATTVNGAVANLLTFRKADGLADGKPCERADSKSTSRTSGRATKSTTEVTHKTTHNATSTARSRRRKLPKRLLLLARISLEGPRLRVSLFGGATRIRYSEGIRRHAGCQAATAELRRRVTMRIVKLCHDPQVCCEQSEPRNRSSGGEHVKNRTR